MQHVEFDRSAQILSIRFTREAAAKLSAAIRSGDPRQIAEAKQHLLALRGSITDGMRTSLAGMDDRDHGNIAAVAKVLEGHGGLTPEAALLEAQVNEAYAATVIDRWTQTAGRNKKFERDIRTIQQFISTQFLPSNLRETAAENSINKDKDRGIDEVPFLSETGDSGSYSRKLKRSRIDPYGPELTRISAILHEEFHRDQDINGVFGTNFEKAAIYFFETNAPAEMSMLVFMSEADSCARDARAQYDMHLHDEKRALKANLKSENYGHIYKAYCDAVDKDSAAHYDGSAMRAAFKAWFDNPALLELYAKETLALFKDPESGRTLAGKSASFDEDVKEAAFRTQIGRLSIADQMTIKRGFEVTDYNFIKQQIDVFANQIRIGHQLPVAERAMETGLLRPKQ